MTRCPGCHFPHPATDCCPVGDHHRMRRIAPAPALDARRPRVREVEVEAELTATWGGMVSRRAASVDW